MSSGQKWYYEEWGELAGPVDGATMCDMVRLGVVAPATPVWRDGMIGRQPVGMVPELKEHVPEMALWNPQATEGYPQGAGLPPVPLKTPNSGRAVASLVFGIISLSFYCVWPVSIPCGIIGMVLGLVANRGPRKQSLATAGLVMSFLGVLLPALVFFFVIMTK